MSHSISILHSVNVMEFDSHILMFLFKVGSVLGEQCATTCDDTNSECSPLGEMKTCSCKMGYYDNGGMCDQSMWSYDVIRL